jgi:exodeoxyribonuclease III
VRFATFNVNSIRARIAATQTWLEQRQPDVVVLQETKVIDADFPSEEFVRNGYGVATSGQKTYNGVAILSRLPMRDIRIGLLDDKPDDERRYISASIGALRCVSVYVPNGKAVGHPAFQAKLVWLERLRETLLAETQQYDCPIVMGGDFNIAADERDVWSPEAMQGQIHFHPDERAALQKLMGNELVDAFRAKCTDSGQFSWWDYRGPSLRLNRGLRIDYVFVSRQLVGAIDQAVIDADVRRGERPSDHVPVVVDLGV